MPPTTNIFVITSAAAEKSGGELVKAWAEVLNALLWPVATLIITAIFCRYVLPLVAEHIKRGGKLIFKVKDAEFSVEPAQVSRPPGVGEADEHKIKLSSDKSVEYGTSSDTLPLDYFFLNHTSFLKPERQAEYRERTRVERDHYHIHVILDSYYRGALRRVDFVEYILHKAYPEPIQYRRDPKDKFLLKELANGEYVLMARVFLKDRAYPVLLQRYITLWSTGPVIP